MKNGRYREVCVSPFAPKEPVLLGGGFAFPFTSNTPKKKRVSGKVMMVERPDLDNLIKGTQDALVYATPVRDSPTHVRKGVRVGVRVAPTL